MKTSCIIVDDEPVVLILLERYISKIPSLELKGQFRNWPDTVDFLQEQCVDVIFTNIDMPGVNGMEMAGFRPPTHGFIFITESGKHALDNFPYHVIAYLLKPLIYINFAQAVKRIAISPEKQSINIRFEVAQMFVKISNKMVRICFEDILFIKGENEYVSLHFKDERLLIYKRMKDMEGLLPASFMRVHLSYIINTNYVVKVVANKYVFIGEKKIPIGGTYRTRVKNYIDLRAF